MVAFLKFMAEKESDPTQKTRIFAIEEPETYLHPRAQRALMDSLRKLKEKGNQIVITSHSPVFAAEATEEDIILVSRGSSQASIAYGAQVDRDSIVDELGIMPRDAVSGYAACVFVEGQADKVFFETISRTLFQSGQIADDFEHKRIGFVPVGGDNLRFFVEKELVLKKLNRKFAVIVDSDRTSPDQQVPAKVERWKRKCEEEGGQFFILRKRAIENYLSPIAIQRVLSKKVDVQDFNNVKEALSTNYDWRKHLMPVVEAMSSDEIMQMDAYTADSTERHELSSIIKTVLRLS